MKNTITCYAWGRPGSWEAICADFDLAVQGVSLEEVRSELNDAVETYRSYIAELPEAERGRLLKRKAPLGLRIKLAVLCRLSRWLLPLRVRTADRYSYHPEYAGNPVA